MTDVFSFTESVEDKNINYKGYLILTQSQFISSRLAHKPNYTFLTVYQKYTQIHIKSK